MWKKIVYLTIILLIPSCEVKINCPGFPETHLVWMPYIQGEEFSLTDGIDTFQFTVKSVDISKAYSFTGFKWYYLNPPSKESCEYKASCTITSPNHDYSEIRIYGGDSQPVWTMFKIYLSTPNSEYSEIFIFYYGVENNVEKIVSKYNTGEEIVEEILNMSSYNNGYKIYSDVLFLEDRTIYIYPNEHIYQIYYAKNVGIIQIKDPVNNKTWSLIE